MTDKYIDKLDKAIDENQKKSNSLVRAVQHYIKVGCCVNATSHCVIIKKGCSSTASMYMAEKIDLTGMKIPNHVAIILDGNGRWAKKRMLPRNMGHTAGAKTVERILEDANDIGIKYVTVYAFSTENWNRPNDEVSALMKLLRNYLEDCIKRANKNNMRVRVIGERGRLDSDILGKIEELEEASKNNAGINFTIALNYGSRDEIARAVKRIAKDCRDGRLETSEITEELISSYLDTKDLPDPDLLIRTSERKDFPTIFYGSWHIQSFILLMYYEVDFNKEGISQGNNSVQWQRPKIWKGK